MLRLTGGEFRGRMIRTLSNDKTRPTQSRTRQALFNSLQSILPEARVLDLFAGSGALGFEALSRGASHAVFVESARAAVSILSKNAEDLEVLGRAEIIAEDVGHAWSHVLRHAPYDLIVADPPYAHGWEMKLIQGAPWPELLKVGGYFCLEWGAQKSQIKTLPDTSEHLIKVREKKYGDTILTSYSRR